jgi:uncharacterized damage-inducible protein DinB
METGPSLSSHIQRTVTGPMWHGPALSELLHGVEAEDAAARPIAGAHTIWELVLHITAWAEIARDRLEGRRTSGITDAENFPTPPAPTEANWSAAVAAMHTAYDALARDAGGLSEAQLKARVPEGEPPHNVATLIAGVIEHGTYHGGQIAILKKALAATPLKG